MKQELGDFSLRHMMTNNKFSSNLLSNLNQSMNKMVCQEDIFDFFVELSKKMEIDAYPILDNLVYEFPGFASYDEIMEEKEFERELDELRGDQ